MKKMTVVLAVLVGICVFWVNYGSADAATQVSSQGWEYSYIEGTAKLTIVAHQNGEVKHKFYHVPFNNESPGKKDSKYREGRTAPCPGLLTLGKDDSDTTHTIYEGAECKNEKVRTYKGTLNNTQDPFVLISGNTKPTPTDNTDKTDSSRQNSTLSPVSLPLCNVLGVAKCVTPTAYNVEGADPSNPKAFDSNSCYSLAGLFGTYVWAKKSCSEPPFSVSLSVLEDCTREGLGFVSGDPGPGASNAIDRCNQRNKDRLKIACGGDAECEQHVKDGGNAGDTTIGDTPDAPIDTAPLASGPVKGFYNPADIVLVCDFDEKQTDVTKQIDEGFGVIDTDAYSEKKDPEMVPIVVSLFGELSDPEDASILSKLTAILSLDGDGDTVTEQECQKILQEYNRLINPDECAVKLSIKIDINGDGIPDECVKKGEGGFASNPIIVYLKAFLKIVTGGVAVLLTGALVVVGYQFIASRGNPQQLVVAKTNIVKLIASYIGFLLAVAILEFLVPGGVFF